MYETSPLWSHIWPSDPLDQWAVRHFQSCAETLQSVERNSCAWLWKLQLPWTLEVIFADASMTPQQVKHTSNQVGTCCDHQWSILHRPDSSQTSLTSLDWCPQQLRFSQRYIVSLWKTFSHKQRHSWATAVIRECNKNRTQGSECGEA